jgi:hypothetical protein
MQALAARLGIVAVLLAAVPLSGNARQDKGEDKLKTWTVKLAEGARDARTIEPKQGEYVQIILSGTAKSDVDLYVYDPDGKEIARDNTPGPDGFVTFQVNRQGKYKVEVHNNVGLGASTSTVLVDTIPVPPTSWTVEMPAKKRYTRAVLLKPGQKVNVTLTGKNVKSDIDLFVILNNKLVGSDTSVGPNGKVEFTARETGVYYVTIRNVSSQADVSTVEVRAGKN